MSAFLSDDQPTPVPRARPANVPKLDFGNALPDRAPVRPKAIAANQRATSNTNANAAAARPRATQLELRHQIGLPRQPKLELHAQPSPPPPPQPAPQPKTRHAAELMDGRYEWKLQPSAHDGEVKQWTKLNRRSVATVKSARSKSSSAAVSSRRALSAKDAGAIDSKQASDRESLCVQSSRYSLNSPQPHSVKQASHTAARYAAIPSSASVSASQSSRHATADSMPAAGSVNPRGVLSHHSFRSPTKLATPHSDRQHYSPAFRGLTPRERTDRSHQPDTEFLNSGIQGIAAGKQSASYSHSHSPSPASFRPSLSPNHEISPSPSSRSQHPSHASNERTTPARTATHAFTQRSKPNAISYSRGSSCASQFQHRKVEAASDSGRSQPVASPSPFPVNLTIDPETYLELMQINPTLAFKILFPHHPSAHQRARAHQNATEEAKQQFTSDDATETDEHPVLHHRTGHSRPVNHKYDRLIVSSEQREDQRSSEDEAKAEDSDDDDTVVINDVDAINDSDNSEGEEHAEGKSSNDTVTVSMARQSLPRSSIAALPSDSSDLFHPSHRFRHMLNEPVGTESSHSIAANTAAFTVERNNDREQDEADEGRREQSAEHVEDDEVEEVIAEEINEAEAEQDEENPNDSEIGRSTPWTLGTATSHFTVKASSSHYTGDNDDSDEHEHEASEIRPQVEDDDDDGSSDELLENSLSLTDDSHLSSHALSDKDEFCL